MKATKATKKDECSYSFSNAIRTLAMNCIPETVENSGFRDLFLQFYKTGHKRGSPLLRPEETLPERLLKN